MSAPPAPVAKIDPCEFAFSLKANFEFSVSKDADQRLRSFVDDGVWKISLHRTGATKQAHPMRIILRPKRTWIIPAKQIQLIHQSSSIWDYTCLWKSLDFLLARHKLKADLVQLFEYYQYPSGVMCSHDDFKLSDAPQSTSVFLQNVLSGLMIAQPHNCEEFAAAYGVSKSEIPDTLRTLKRIGYEVRSSNTNQAFESDSFMIPYVFPSLTPLSVQLNKDL